MLGPLWVPYLPQICTSPLQSLMCNMSSLLSLDTGLEPGWYPLSVWNRFLTPFPRRFQAAAPPSGVADGEQSMKKRGLNMVELTRFKEQSVELGGYLDDT